MHKAKFSYKSNSGTGKLAPLFWGLLWALICTWTVGHQDHSPKTNNLMHALAHWICIRIILNGRWGAKWLLWWWHAVTFTLGHLLCFWINGWECNEPPIEQAPQKLEVIWKRALRFGLKHSCGKEKGARKGNTVKSVWLRINASQGIWSSQSVAVKKKESCFFLPSDKLGVCSDKKTRSFLKLLLFAVLFSLFFWSQKAILWSHFQQNKWIKMK